MHTTDPQNLSLLKNHRVVVKRGLVTVGVRGSQAGPFVNRVALSVLLQFHLAILSPLL